MSKMKTPLTLAMLALATAAQAAPKVIKNYVCTGEYSHGTKAAGVGYCDFATYERGRPTQPFAEIEKVCQVGEQCHVTADVIALGKFGGDTMHYSIVHVTHVEKVSK
jgi:hypothetical protein